MKYGFNTKAFNIYLFLFKGEENYPTSGAQIVLQ